MNPGRQTLVRTAISRKRRCDVCQTFTSWLYVMFVISNYIANVIPLNKRVYLHREKYHNWMSNIISITDLLQIQKHYKNIANSIMVLTYQTNAMESKWQVELLG